MLAYQSGKGIRFSIWSEVEIQEDSLKWGVSIRSCVSRSTNISVLPAGRVSYEDGVYLEATLQQHAVKDHLSCIHQS